MKIKNYKAGYCLIVTLMLIPRMPAIAQTTYYVDDLNGVDSRTGTGAWTNALNTISNAVAKAGDTDTILVTGGVYNVTAQIDITNAISLIGVDGPTNTFIVGDYTKRGFMLSNEAATVSGFTITNFKAHAIPGFSYNFGGGALIMGGGTITNCIFTGNFGGRGGGIEAGGIGATHWAGEYTIANCIFSNNISTYWGGGMLAMGTGIIINCIFEGNISQDTGAGAGAGLSATFADNSGMISGCVFRANTGNFGASGVHLSKGTITHSDIINNTSAGTTMSFGSYATACWCRIEGNIGGRGAALNVNSGAHIRNCLIAGNTNTVSYGSAIEMNDGIIESCTIANNVSTHTNATGGIWFYTWSGHPARTIINTIIYSTVKHSWFNLGHLPLFVKGFFTVFLVLVLFAPNYCDYGGFRDIA